LWRKKEYGKALSVLYATAKAFLAQNQTDPQAYAPLASAFSSRLVEIANGKASSCTGKEVLEPLRGMFSVFVNLPPAVLSDSDELWKELCSFANEAVMWSRTGTCASGTSQAKTDAVAGEGLKAVGGSGSRGSEAKGIVYTIGDPAVLAYAAQLLALDPRGGVPSATEVSGDGKHTTKLSSEMLKALHFAAHACYPVPALCQNQTILLKYVLRALAVGNVAVANRAVGIYCDQARKRDSSALGESGEVANSPGERGAQARLPFEKDPQFIFSYLLVNVVIKRSLKAAKLLKVRFRDVLTDKEDQQYLQTIINVYVDTQDLD